MSESRLEHQRRLKMESYDRAGEMAIKFGLLKAENKQLQTEIREYEQVWLTSGGNASPCVKMKPLKALNKLLGKNKQLQAELDGLKRTGR